MTRINIIDSALGEGSSSPDATDSSPSVTQSIKPKIKSIMLTLTLSLLLSACLAPSTITPCTILGEWGNTISFSEACTSPVVYEFTRGGIYVEEIFFPVNCGIVPDSLEGLTRILAYGTFTESTNFIQPYPIVTYSRDVTGDWDTIMGGTHIGFNYIGIFGCDTLPFAAGIGNGGVILYDTLIRL